MNSEKLTHLIYFSTACESVSSSDLRALLEVARFRNRNHAITGLLIYAPGSFFQVLEGDEVTVAKLFEEIKSDSRHTKVTKIIHEPIAKRDFGDWSMGFAEINAVEVADIDGLRDCLQKGACWHDLDPGRAKKLLAAFLEGRWRRRIQGGNRASDAEPMTVGQEHGNPWDISFAFQPIVDIDTATAYSHEALVRGLNKEPAGQVLARYRRDEMPAFDEACRAKAIEVAARLGISTNLNINFLPSMAFDLLAGIDSSIRAANRYSFPLDHIIVEATEGEAIDDHTKFARAVNEYRRAGIRFAIDDFGAGHSGLNLLSEFQPDMVKLDMAIARGIEAHGPRQAIVRGIRQVCADLGIDLVVEGVETIEEFHWFQEEGVKLYQGYLFAKPEFEAIPLPHIPDPTGYRGP